jgi:hypothetical protein
MCTVLQGKFNHTTFKTFSSFFQNWSNFSGENLFYTTEFVQVQRFAIDIISFYNIPVTLSIVLQYIIRLELFFKKPKIPLETYKISYRFILLEV